MMMENRKRHIASYRASTKRAFWELTTTFLIWILFIIGYGRIINRIIFYIFFPFINMRIFMIFHDAGHGSLFPYRRWNKLLVQVTSIIVMTPTHWIGEHRLHHAHGGNMQNDSNFQWNPTIYLTKQELQHIRPAILKKLYTFIRNNPMIYFPFVSFYDWFIRYRIPNFDKTQPFTFINNIQNTISVFGFWYLLYQSQQSYSNIAPLYIVLDNIGAAYLGGIYGYLLFHAQHVFEGAYVAESREEWNFVDCCFKGSSFIDFPWFLQWFMMGIGYHHIHHYDSKVPGYLLKQCHDEGDPLFWKDVHVLDFFETGNFWKTLTLTTYDMQSHTFQ